MAIGRLLSVTREAVDPKTGEITQQDVLEGELLTLRLSMKLRLVALGRRQSDKAPTHVILGNVVGHWAEIGKAWLRRVERGENAGAPMFSLSFEDEEVAASVPNAAAFQISNESGAFEIVRERPRQPQAGAAA